MAPTSSLLESSLPRTPSPLRLRRLTLGLTQREVARIAGISPEQLSNLETGKADPYLSTVLALADALGCEAADLLPFKRETPAAIRGSAKTADRDGGHEPEYPPR